MGEGESFIDTANLFYATRKYNVISKKDFFASSASDAQDARTKNSSVMTLHWVPVLHHVLLYSALVP